MHQSSYECETDLMGEEVMLRVEYWYYPEVKATSDSPPSYEHVDIGKVELFRPNENPYTPDGRYKPGQWLYLDVMDFLSERQIHQLEEEVLEHINEMADIKAGPRVWATCKRTAYQDAVIEGLVERGVTGFANL